MSTSIARFASLSLLLSLSGCGSPASTDGAGSEHAGGEHACGAECPCGERSGHGHGRGHGGGHGPGDGSGHGMHGEHGETAHDAHAGHPGGHGMVHDFSDVARFEQMFDAPDRAGWQRPVEVVSLVALSPGQTAVDLGTGTGYFLPFLSLAVGGSGHVLALDAEPAMVEHVRARAEREGLGNVEARAVTAAEPGLAPASVDRILIVDTWHHLPERAAYAARLRDALRPGGSIVVVDFTRESPHGPPPEMRLSPEVVVAELAQAGLAAEIVTETLPYQYVVRATRRP